MMTADVAEMMLRPHALATGRNQTRFGLPAIGADGFACQENGAIQLNAIEADVAADLNKPKNRSQPRCDDDDYDGMMGGMGLCGRKDRR